jgi:uncharacterized protein
MHERPIRLAHRALAIVRSVAARGLRGNLASGCLLAALVALGLSACSQFRDLYPKINGMEASGQYDQAAALIEKNKDQYGDRNFVLYQMDLGTMLHYAGKYEESNKAFAAAEQKIDELYTESITGNVAAFAVNDNLLPYKGEDFESVIVDIYQALNYVELGNIDNALVFARKVDQKLDVINRQYDPDKKNVYKEDAFARMLMGALYEISGSRDDLNDSYISSRLATGIYDKDFSVNYGVPAPSVLGANLLTAAAFMGSEELDQAKQRYPNAPLMTAQDIREKYGQLYFVHFAGRSPVKVEGGFAGVYGTVVVKVVFPEYRRVNYLVSGSQVSLDGQPATRLDPAEPIGAIAIKNLENRKTRIYAKAIARAGAKAVANLVLQRQAQKQGGDVAGLLAAIAGGVATAATEQADLRCWQTLPDKILFGRVLLPPGKHRLTVQFTTGAGAVVATKDLGDVEVPPGHSKFIILQSNN